MLKNVDDTYHYIPVALAYGTQDDLEFTEKTKVYLPALLSKLQQKDDTDVHALLKELKSTCASSKRW